jgi:hypothetical protein
MFEALSLAEPAVSTGVEDLLAAAGAAGCASRTLVVSTRPEAAALEQKLRQFGREALQEEAAAARVIPVNGEAFAELVEFDPPPDESRGARGGL